MKEEELELEEDLGEDEGGEDEDGGDSESEGDSDDSGDDGTDSGGLSAGPASPGARQSAGFPAGGPAGDARGQTGCWAKGNIVQRARRPAGAGPPVVSVADCRRAAETVFPAFLAARLQICHSLSDALNPLFFLRSPGAAGGLPALPLLMSISCAGTMPRLAWVVSCRSMPARAPKRSREQCDEE